MDAPFGRYAAAPAGHALKPGNYRDFVVVECPRCKKQYVMEPFRGRGRAETDELMSRCQLTCHDCRTVFDGYGRER